MTIYETHHVHRVVEEPGSAVNSSPHHRKKQPSWLMPREWYERGSLSHQHCSGWMPDGTQRHAGNARQGDLLGGTKQIAGIKHIARKVAVRLGAPTFWHISFIVRARMSFSKCSIVIINICRTGKQSVSRRRRISQADVALHKLLVTCKDKPCSSRFPGCFIVCIIRIHAHAQIDLPQVVRTSNSPCLTYGAANR